jgi:predicted nucleotidyltransferase
MTNKFQFDEVIGMIDISSWMHNFLKVLNDTFENRVWFVGLQGSYGRGEATETSDIDIVRLPPCKASRQNHTNLQRLFSSTN